MSAHRDSPAAAPAAPPPLVDFMAQAIAMEQEAAQRYEEFADAMEMHNNREVAQMFRKLAGIESRHADELLAEMGWTELPVVPRIAFEGFEGAETPPVDAVHYLMTPWHVLQVALAAEERAVRFFTRLLEVATDPAVRRAANEMLGEEREHVELVRAWMGRVEQPADGWAVDPDPPRYTD
jgi:rubrerythrin